MKFYHWALQRVHSNSWLDVCLDRQCELLGLIYIVVCVCSICHKCSPVRFLTHLKKIERKQYAPGHNLEHQRA